MQWAERVCAHALPLLQLAAQQCTAVLSSAASGTMANTDVCRRLKSFLLVPLPLMGQRSRRGRTWVGQWWQPADACSWGWASAGRMGWWLSDTDPTQGAGGACHESIRSCPCQPQTSTSWRQEPVHCRDGAVLCRASPTHAALGMGRYTVGFMMAPPCRRPGQFVL